VQHEECLELLLEQQQVAVIVDAQDKEGCTPLHHAVQGCLPMAAYMLATKGGAAACLIKNRNGKSAVDLAAASERGEASPEGVGGVGLRWSWSFVATSSLEADIVAFPWTPAATKYFYYQLYDHLLAIPLLGIMQLVITLLAIGCLLVEG
jgi:hypothetical protein